MRLWTLVALLSVGSLRGGALTEAEVVRKSAISLDPPQPTASSRRTNATATSTSQRQRASNRAARNASAESRRTPNRTSSSTPKRPQHQRRRQRRDSTSIVVARAIDRSIRRVQIAASGAAGAAFRVAAATRSATIATALATCDLAAYMAHGTIAAARVTLAASRPHVARLGTLGARAAHGAWRGAARGGNVAGRLFSGVAAAGYRSVGAAWGAVGQSRTGRRSAKGTAAGGGVSRSQAASQRAQIARIIALGDDEEYAALQVEEKASTAQIKSAFRRLARLIHPDKCTEPHAHAAFLRLQAAHTTLTDTDQRASLDERKALERRHAYAPTGGDFGLHASWSSSEASKKGQKKADAAPKPATRGHATGTARDSGKKGSARAGAGRRRGGAGTKVNMKGI